MTLLHRIPKTAWIYAVLLAALAAFVLTRLDTSSLDGKAAATAPPSSAGAVKVAKGPDELPKEEDFRTVAQSGELELRLDAKTGHFAVADKRNGNVWRSYPDPSQWSTEAQEGIWRTHLRAPVMFRYIDLTGKLSQPKESNLLEERGTVKDVAAIDGGFRLTFDMPSKQIAIPIEVKVEGDSVVAKMIDSGIKEGDLSLIWVRLYPFFGAEHSDGQEGYLFVPDGSGALIPYEEHNTNVNRIYQEPVYGTDLSFKVNDEGQSRKTVAMPVFGAKSGDRAYLSIIEDGAEFTEIVAAPSGVFSGYNWVTAQQNYRSTYKQVTNESKNKFFLTYNKDERFRGDRAVRYVLLDKPKADYVGMAQRYRDYLMKTYGMKPIKPKSDKLPMTINLIGAERERGLITDRYLKTTTTADAMKIVQRLYGLGIENMTVNYMGWNKGGYSAFGAPAPVDGRLGGDDGMRQFVKFADTLGIPVYLHTNYLVNTTDAGSFNKKRHGLRDLGGTVIEPFVSLGFLGPVLDKDIAYFKTLGVAGVTTGQLGESLNSDFNTNFPASREESRKLQQSYFQKFRDAGLDVRGMRSSFFAVPYVSAIDRMPDDYSYDSFSASAVPFMQIALHGLVSYTSDYANDREQYHLQFLRDLEYGSAPSFIFIYENGEQFKYAFELHPFSPSFQDWESEAVQEYQRMSEALGDVQDRFIVNHRTLAPEVKETTYDGGKRIIVNYGTKPYEAGGLTVKPMDYLIVKGGTAP
ncbi:DUF5696 domain-containing protein [Paenibacillus flagellatus]|uniref:Uncharacterized protein n=1 Tax=Paenibacillus flagellatus TaxID=2211139 RepID=A0A2V5KBK6_9BACL|nr:DUF5696 domain-containing protein [Paenibacillus flagellatus]PYI56342.1 hypothetical protein DLM86_05015 [Paenibacillus flagellatus]